MADLKKVYILNGKSILIDILWLPSHIVDADNWRKIIVPKYETILNKSFDGYHGYREKDKAQMVKYLRKP